MGRNNCGWRPHSNNVPINRKIANKTKKQNNKFIIIQAYLNQNL